MPWLFYSMTEVITRASIWNHLSLTAYRVDDMENDGRWFVQPLATNDGSGDVIVELPAVLLQELGLRVGDNLALNTAGDTITLTPIRSLEPEYPKGTEVLRAQADESYRSRMNVLLGIPTDATDLQIHEIIDAGFEVKALTALGHLGLIAPGTLEAIVPLQSLKMKQASGERLTASESDDLFRLAHAIALAEFFFGDTKKAMRWLSKPKSEFSGKSPIDLLSTTVGLRQVEDLLVQATDGVPF